MTIADNLTSIINAKNDIKNAINEKGVELDDKTPLNQYANKIRQIDIDTVWGEIGGDIENQTDLIEKLKINNGYLTGDISTNEKGLEQLKQMKSSTFDRSKFTVIGTPTITDDGIASGFSGSNYLRFQTKLDVTKPYIIKGSFVTKDTYPTVTAPIIGVNNISGNEYAILLQISATQRKLGFILQTGTGSIHNDYVGDILDLNTKYYYIIEFTGNAYEISLSTDGFNYSLLKSIASDKYVSIGNGITYIGYRAELNWSYYNEIDLKEINIKSDGIEVFNGNKTGIDQIKKDDYTVVGSPVINADGIAISLNSNNYLQAPLNIISGNKFEISFHFKVPDNAVTGFLIGDITSARALAPYIYYYADSDKLQLGFSTDGESLTNYYTSNLTIQKNKDYIAKITSEKGVGTSLVLYHDNVSEIFIDPQGSERIYSIKDLSIGTGKASDGSLKSTTSSFNLNEFKIYVDDNLVYQPTLRIPYTLSKTGSKIVDAVYRDRVQQMYNSLGYAPYYTLSETDFTLPMGEIYGMIEKSVDGAWVQKNLAVATNVNFDGTTKNYSLADYLPNDNNIYEVYGYGIVVTGSVSGNSSSLLLSSSNYDALGVCRAITRTTATNTASGAFIIPIGTDRQLSGGSTSTTGTYQIHLRGYRRIK